MKAANLMRSFFVLCAFVFFIVPALSHAKMKCGGQEPFWSLDLDAKKAAYSDVETEKSQYEIVSVKDAAGLKPGIVQVYQLKKKDAVLNAVVQKQKCSDDMSDKIYPYEITLISQQVMYGCCE